MKQNKCANNTISHKKSEIKSRIDDFREFIKVYGFKYNKKRLSNLRRSLKNHEKIVYDEKEDDIEYLKGRIDYLKCLKNGCFKQNQYQDKNIKYHGIEAIKYLFDDEDDEDYNLYPIKDQQYQSFSGRILLLLNEYLEKIRAELVKIIKNCKINLIVSTIFKLKINFNDKSTIQIKNKNTTDIDEIFDELIKKHDLIESLKNADLIPEGIESMIYNVAEIITSNTFIESPEWIKIKNVQSTQKVKIINAFYFLLLLL